ncbi:MAG: hypothetical protein J3Q66DRAFT_89037 [Benniella sp.]|nr:MAG: hypothetical protein J3Q66DRAFT_89037 [Benniella sp.]
MFHFGLVDRFVLYGLVSHSFSSSYSHFSFLSFFNPLIIMAVHFAFVYFTLFFFSFSSASVCSSTLSFFCLLSFINVFSSLSICRFSERRGEKKKKKLVVSRLFLS